MTENIGNYRLKSRGGIMGAVIFHDVERYRLT
jgi:hypothetical protein